MTADAPAAARPEPDWRRSWRKRAQVALIAGLGAPLLAVLGRTWRWTTVGGEHLDALGTQNRIYALWHGRILHCLLYWRDQGIVVITSENFDGEWIARIIQRFGFGVARGSSTRGGARAVRELLRVAAHAPPAFTVDGPRGPRHVAQPGAAWLASATGLPVVCIHAEADRCWTVNSWDRTQIPKPFSRLVMAISPPVRVAAGADAGGVEAGRAAVEAALSAAQAACARALGRAEPRG